MSNWNKSAIVVAVIAATGLAGAGVAMAWGGDCEYEGRGGEHRSMHKGNPERMGERMEAHITKLRSSLALRDDQIDAWNTLERTVRSQIEAVGQRMMVMREAKRPATALERMQRMEEMSSARGESMREVRKAVEVLYPQLDATQQKNFDQQFRMGMRGRDGRQRGGVMKPN